MSKILQPLSNDKEGSSNKTGDVMNTISELKPKGEATPDELLYYLQHHLTDDYRYIRFPIKRKADLFAKRVSFDTINLQYDQDSDDSDDDGLNDYNFGSYERNRGRDLTRSPSPNHRSPLHSPSPSGMFRTPYENNSLFLNSKMNRKNQLIYPTTPIITHRGCTFTKAHPDFEKLYQGKLQIETEQGKKVMKPIVRGRVILIYISARKHTWVALDWIFNKFIEHGDRVVIVSSMSSNMTPRRRSFSYLSPAKKGTPEARFKNRSKPDYAIQIAQNIMKYVLQVIDLKKITKVTVELAVGDCKSVLKDMYKLYQPNLVCLGTKPNQSVGAPLKSWTSSRLIDRLVKNFPLPVIVVPAMNMNEFEFDLQSKIKKDKTGIKSTPNEFFTRLQSESFVPVLKSDNDYDSQSISSATSEASVSSGESYSSFIEITELYVNYRKDLKRNLKDLSQETMDEHYFSNIAKLVSDKSAELCQELRSIDPDFRGNGAKLARAITGSNIFGIVPYKTKSLLGPVEGKPKPSPPLNTISYKDLKKKLKSTGNIPKIEINSTTPPPSETPPKKLALKFADLEKPVKNVEEEPKGLSKSKFIKSKTLKKSLSHEIDSLSNRPKLSATKSQPEITNIHPSSQVQEEKPDSSKGRRKKFWRLFK